MSNEERDDILNDELFMKFVPPAGMQYSTLKFLSAEEIKKLPPEQAKMYDSTRPDWNDNKNKKHK